MPPHSRNRIGPHATEFPVSVTQRTEARRAVASYAGDTRAGGRLHGDPDHPPVDTAEAAEIMRMLGVHPDQAAEAAADDAKIHGYPDFG